MRETCWKDCFGGVKVPSRVELRYFAMFGRSRPDQIAKFERAPKSSLRAIFSIQPLLYESDHPVRVILLKHRNVWGKITGWKGTYNAYAQHVAGLHIFTPD